MSMRKFRPEFRLPHIGSTERWLMVVIALMVLFLALTTDTFFTLVNLFDLLNISAVNDNPVLATPTTGATYTEQAMALAREVDHMVFAADEMARAGAGSRTRG